MPNHIPDWTRIEGFFDSKDAGIYERWAAQVPDNSIIVELGTWLGRSAACLLTNLIQQNKLHVKLICIDNGPQARTPEAHSNLQPYCDRMRELRGGAEFVNLELLRADARKCYIRFKDESIWGCFIDSNHDYDPTKKQIERWWPKLQIGGRMGFHDYQPSFPGVLEAVASGFPGRVPDFTSGYVAEFIKNASFVLPALL